MIPFNPKIILNKEYSAESIIDLDDDINDAMQGLPKDENGFEKGDFQVMIVFREFQE